MRFTAVQEQPEILKHEAFCEIHREMYCLGCNRHSCTARPGASGQSVVPHSTVGTTIEKPGREGPLPFSISLGAIHQTWNASGTKMPDIADVSGCNACGCNASYIASISGCHTFDMACVSGCNTLDVAYISGCSTSGIANASGCNTSEMACISGCFFLEFFGMSFELRRGPQSENQRWSRATSHTAHMQASTNKAKKRDRSRPNTRPSSV